MQADLSQAPAVSAVQFGLIMAMCAGSIAVLFYLFQKHIRGESLLDYEHRWQVPWGSGIVLAVMLFAFSGVVYSLVQDETELQGPQVTEPAGAVPVGADKNHAGQPELPATRSVPEFVAFGLSTTIIQLTLVGMCALWLRTGCDADFRDLGLPRDSKEFFADLRTGFLACLAAFLPIYILQITLVLLLQSQVEHPLVTELRGGHSLAMMLSALLVAVIAAPISEEFFFRLLLQGWLESWEDQKIGFSGTTRIANTTVVTPESMAGETLAGSAEAVAVTTPDESNSFLEEPQFRPAAGYLGFLPHGWLPIVLSGILFGLAHVGQGVAPVSLVLFGIVLGYLYQRTHRLIPSITAHAMFNAYSLVMLWLALENPASP